MKIHNVTTSLNSTSADLITWHYKRGTSNSKGCEFMLIQGDIYNPYVSCNFSGVPKLDKSLKIKQNWFLAFAIEIRCPSSKTKDKQH